MRGPVSASQIRSNGLVSMLSNIWKKVMEMDQEKRVKYERMKFVRRLLKNNSTM